MVIIFVCMSVGEKMKYDKRTWHHWGSKPWKSYTGHRTYSIIGEQNFPLVKFGPHNCPASGYGNYVPQFFRMFGDSVYDYHDNATLKNVGSCLLPGS